MSSTGSLPELDALRSQVADLSHQLTERDRSVQDLREHSAMLRAMVENTATETGDEFFAALVTHLTSVLHVKYALIGEVQGDHIKKIRTLAVSAGGAIVDNFEYELTHTPCATALAQSCACFNQNVRETFPQFQRLADLGAESYCAVSIRAKDGAVKGLLIVMDTKPLEHSDALQSLLGVFAPRVAAEFERKRAEQERAQALADLHNVIETIPDIVFALDTQGNVVKWNRRLGDVTGYSPEELLNKPALAFVPPEEQARTAAAIQRVFVEGYAELEGHLLTKAHRLIPYHWTGALLKNTHGEPIGITGIGRDVSDKKRAEEALQVSEGHLSSFIMNSSSLVFSKSQDGRYLFVNPEFERVFHLPAGHIIGKTDYDVFPPEQADQFVANDRRVFQEGHHVKAEETARYRDGIHAGLVTKFPLRNADGSISGLGGIVIDITERKRAETALRESEERYRTLVDLSPNGVLVYSNGKKVYVNQAACRIIGAASPEQLLDNPTVHFSHPDDHESIHASIAQILATGEPVRRVERKYQRLDGAVIFVEVDAGRIMWNGAPAIQVIFADITERKQAEEDLRESEAFNISVLNSLSSQIVVLNSQGVIMAVNKPWLRFAEENGASHLVENFVGMNYLNVCAQAPLFANGEEAASAEAGILAVLAGTNNEFTLEYPCHSPDQQRWFRMRVTPLLDSQAGVVVAHENITERKQAEEALRVSEGHFRAIFENAAVGIAFGSYTMGTGISQVNPAFQSMTGYNSEELCRLGMKGVTYSGDFPASNAFLERLVSGAQSHGTIEKRYVKKDGSTMWAQTTVSSILNKQGGYEHSIAMIQDITTRKVNEQLLAAEKRVLELIATDAPLQDILMLMCQAVGELSPGVHCSILLLDRDGLHLRHGAAPSLPEVYAHAIDGLAIGPSVGSCGTAAFTRRQVIVSNIAEDPLWTDYRDLALCHGLKACWSTPVISSDGAVLGTFAVYYGEPQQPTHADLRLVEWAAQIACIAIERKQTEEALRKSEERYARATAVGKVGVWELDVATGTYHGDPNLKALFGYADDELSTDPLVWLNLVHSDDQSIAMDHWQRIVNGEMDDSNYELRMLKKDGTVIWTDVRGHAVRDHEGQVTQLFGATVDITERKQVQDALAQSEHQLRTVLDALPVGVWFTDRLGRPLLENPMAKRILSTIKQIGLQDLDNAVSWWETAEPATDPHRRALSHALRTGVPTLNETLELECLDGRKKIIRNSTVPIQDEAGNILGAVVLNEDVTMLRQAQAALQMTQFSIDHAIEGFFWIGPDAGIFHVNDAACRMLEYSCEELTAMTVHDIDPNFSPEAWPTHWAELKRKGSLTFESKYWSRTGRVLDTEVTVNYLQHEEKEYSCAIMRDIEPRKRADAALRASEERYRSLYDETPIMYFTLATDGRVRSVNRFGANQLGYQAEELIGHSVLGFFHEEDKETVAASLSECFATPEIPRHWEFRKIRKDGTVIWVQETVRVSQSSTGETVVLVTCEDITERKRAEQESDERILQVSAMQAALLELAHLDDTSLPFSTILPHVTRIVADVLAVERVSMWLLSGDQNELVCQDLYLRSQATHSAGSRLAASSYPRYLAVLKENLVIGASNAPVDQRTSEFADDYYLSFGITSVLDVPIRRQGKVIGVLWCEHVGMPREWTSEVQDFGASVGQTIAHMIEASERRRAEMSLRQSEERYRSLLDNAPIGIFVNKAGRFAYANREFQRILNATRAEQLLGTPVLDRIAPELHSVVKDRIHQLMEKGQPVPSLDEQYVRLDGSRIDVAVTAIPTSFDGTDVIQVLVLDIAERKRAEQAQARLIEDLTRSRQHFQSLFNWTPSAVGISTVAEGRFIDVNEGFSRLTGYTREEVIGHTTLELGLWADLSERESVLRKIQEQGYLHNREGLLRTKSGEVRSLMVSVESIQLGSTLCLIYLCHDITDRKRMEDALRTREHELHAALQERERISQDLHDGILQSLFAVGLNLEVFKSRMSPSVRKTSGASLNKAIDQLNLVMREIRNFIAGLSPDPIEGKDLSTALQSMLISLTENQPTRVRLAVEKRAVQAVSAEQSVHVFRVIQEAVSNCIRHGGAQEARVSLKMLKQGVRLSIRDNGRGFSQDTVKAGGFGLRNMAARAQKVGGRFTVLSKENEGTRIILDLPKEVPHSFR